MFFSRRVVVAATTFSALALADGNQTAEVASVLPSVLSTGGYGDVMVMLRYI
jgi:hypothetical protein